MVLSMIPVNQNAWVQIPLLPLKDLGQVNHLAMPQFLHL